MSISLKTTANATLTKTFWDGKAQSFTCERFTSTLTDSFTDLADHGEPKSDAEKVKKLLSAISDQSENSQGDSHGYCSSPWRFQ